MMPKSKSASPEQLLHNDEYEEDQDSIVLPGSVVGSDQESLLSLQHTPTKLMLPPVAESRPMEYTESDNKNVVLPPSKVPKQCSVPFSSLHSHSTPHLFGNAIDDDQETVRSRISVPHIGILSEDTGISNQADVLMNSGSEGSDFEDSQPESDSELFDPSCDVLHILDSTSNPVSPTQESSRSTPARKSTTLPSKRKSSSFKRDSAVRQAKRAISLNIPRNNTEGIPRRGSSADSKYLSSSLLHLHHDLSPSPVSMDRLTTSSVASSYSGSILNSENASPWHTTLAPLHRIVSGHEMLPDNFDLETSNDDTKTLTRNEILVDSPCNGDVRSVDNCVINEGPDTSSTSGSDDLPDNEEKIEGEEKAALEQDMAESTDKNVSLESQIRSEISRVDSIGEKICYIYDNDEPTKPTTSSSSTSEDGVSVHSVELKMEVRSLSPLSENSCEGSLHNKSIPTHSSSNSTSSTELVFIHKQHGSTASEQSVESQHKQLHSETLQTAINDHVPQSPQRPRRLLAITPSFQRLNLSRSTSDVSTEMKSNDNFTASPKTGFKFSLRRKNSLVSAQDNENESLSSSLKREKSKSTTSLYVSKGNWRSPLFSGLPRFKKTKSNGRAKQYETAPTTTHAGPKPKHKKTRTPMLV